MRLQCGPQLIGVCPEVFQQPWQPSENLMLSNDTSIPYWQQGGTAEPKEEHHVGPSWGSRRRSQSEERYLPSSVIPQDTLLRRPRPDLGTDSPLPSSLPQHSLCLTLSPHPWLHPERFKNWKHPLGTRGTLEMCHVLDQTLWLQR